MDFKILSTIHLVVLSLVLGACTSDFDAAEDEDIIGGRLGGISDILLGDDVPVSVVSIFDKTTAKIHQFDLEKMTHLRALDVQHPSESHYVLSHHQGLYTIDMTLKHLSVYDKSGQAHHNPVEFKGKPLSAAFRPELGLLVVYDDLMSVSFLELGEGGRVNRAWVSGPVLGEGQEIRSGDINRRGELVLGLRDGSIAVVDIDQTLKQQQWSFRSVAANLGEILWLAPVPEAPEQVLVRSQSQIILYDLDAEVVLSSLDFLDNGYGVIKYSKVRDPHILIDKRGTWWGGHRQGEVSVVYVKNSELRTRAVYHMARTILVSQLDLKEDTWTYVESDLTRVDVEDSELNVRKTGRRLVRYKLSDLKSQRSRALPDNANLRMSGQYVFSLFQNRLGYATRLSIDSGEVKEAKLFNMGHIRRP